MCDERKWLADVVGSEMPAHGRTTGEQRDPSNDQQGGGVIRERL